MYENRRRHRLLIQKDNNLRKTETKRPQPHPLPFQPWYETPPKTFSQLEQGRTLHVGISPTQHKTQFLQQQPHESGLCSATVYAATSPQAERKLPLYPTSQKSHQPTVTIPGPRHHGRAYVYSVYKSQHLMLQTQQVATHNANVRWV